MIRKIAYITLICAALTLSACATNSGASGAGQPDWVRDPYTKYSRQANVAAAGSGATREAAEKSALGNLAAVFGRDITVDEKVSTAYAQAVKNGVIADWSENTTVDNTISTSTSFDSLIGAEIGDTWYDNRSEYFAVAVLNKAKAAEVYSGLIQSNKAIIDKLVNLPPSEKNTFEGLARYQFAATVADVTVPYANLLSVIGAPARAVASGDDYRLEAANITGAIPVGLTVRNDKSGRIEGAFAKALSGAGFQTGGVNSRYVLDVNIISSPVTIAGNPNKWTRMEISANLGDSRRGTILLPYNFNNRQGHTSQAEADNRAFAQAEQKIDNEYAGLLRAYLSQLLPENR